MLVQPAAPAPPGGHGDATSASITSIHNNNNNTDSDSGMLTPAALRRARSLPSTAARGYLDAAKAGANGEGPAEFRCCAVPELFYEVRKKHVCVLLLYRINVL